MPSEVEASLNLHGCTQNELMPSKIQRPTSKAQSYNKIAGGGATENVKNDLHRLEPTRSREDCHAERSRGISGFFLPHTNGFAPSTQR